MATEDKVKLEELIKPTEKYLRVVGDLYSDFYTYRDERDGPHRQLQGYTFLEYLRMSRELFWTSMITKSEDLEELDLEFALPFIRKEVLDYLGRIVSQQINPVIVGEGTGQLGIKVLQAINKKWRLKSKDKVEKFWQLLYGIVNGTVCIYIGYDSSEKSLKFLRAFNSETGAYELEEKDVKLWDDVSSEIVPIEDIYFAKLWERNVQKQGKTIRKQEFTEAEFRKEYKGNPNADFAVAGNRIDGDSLFFQLLGNSGVLQSKMFQVLKLVDTDNDRQIEVCNGVWLNPLGKDTERPNPFYHKRQPYVVSINEPIDDKFIYGLSMPFKLKDTHKILNTSFTMLVERELRSIDPPILTSDFEAPSLIFGQKKVIPVNDVNAYKELKISEASGQFFTMQNSLQGLMSSFGQGGFSQVAPSRQPKAAREIMALETMKQQSLGNALIMYYDLLYQEIFLVLKTALQFYAAGKYADQSKNILRAMTVPDFALSQGGVGNLEIRVVREPQNALALYFEAVKKSAENGKMTEIIEIPVDIINNLEWFISEIKLEPERTTEMEQALYVENVLTPMLNSYVPAGVASLEKTFLRHMEKLGESVSDYASDEVMGMYMGGGKGRPQAPMATGAQTGNAMQSFRGMTFGSQSNGGFASE